MAIKLCSEFIIPIINITKKEHIKEYNEHIKNIIDNLESIKDIYSICSYLINICCEENFKLSQNPRSRLCMIILIHVKNAIVIIVALVIIIIKKSYMYFSSK